MASNYLSPSLASGDKFKEELPRKDKPYKIFFKDLFLFKENELEARKKEKFMSRSMKIHQKSTFSSRMKSRSHLGQIAFYTDTAGDSFENLGLDPILVLRLTEGSDTRRTVHEFINDQRDRFFLEFSLATKRNTIKKYERSIALKERQLRKAEKKLQDDAMAFEEFLRENDQKSVDALKIAAQETINKLQMTAELKKACMEVQTVKSEIAKAEFLLKEYMKYGLFLLKLSPKQWQAQQALKKMHLSKSKENMNITLPKILENSSSAKKREDNWNLEASRRTSLSEDSLSGKGSQGKQPRKRFSLEKRKSPTSNPPENNNSEDSLEFILDDDTDYALEPELYFKEPEELLQVLTELEEQNLTLVQYSQDVDENLEDVNKREKVIQDKINTNIAFLLEHKEMLKANCLREEEKAAELELRSRLFSFGEFNSEAQKRGLRQDVTWKAFYFARKFIDHLLTVHDGPKVKRKDNDILTGPDSVTYQLKDLHGHLTRRSSKEKLIDSLSKKINQVYRVCIGDAEVGSLNPVQKLVKVESRLAELSDLIESVPKENVEAIEKLKQKERRQKLRDDKMKEKQKHQEERLKAALERAVAQPRKKLGRRLVCRSKPPHGSKHHLLLVSDTTKSQEDDYFFT
ncbi:coiled-coil domain-containing protein 38 isoform X2 [Dasypus novemcinctus]|uniref:coiled-coil domain-containing protein 38 isoform X2 n=1 Tax=Dasypus novemcinctus TaxID=9361 RepID=UPI00265D9412|nr:coiled-coil domain-containing protein 38 isoform X2 [Dasypus novemcinctus]